MANYFCLISIRVIPPSHSKNLLALVKVQILEPSGRVLPKWLHLCPSGFRKFTCVSAQISRNISMTCLLDGSRSRRSWGFPNFHGFWAAPGAIWSRLDGSKQETDCSIRNFGPCSTNSSKKIWRLLLIILLEGSKNKVEILIYNYLGEPSAGHDLGTTSATACFLCTFKMLWAMWRNIPRNFCSSLWFCL